MIRERKTAYYQKECDRLTEAGSFNTPYKVLRNIAEKERAPVWSIRNIRPDIDERTQAEEAADFFAGISQQFTPLAWPIPTVPRDRPVADVSTTQVISRLIHMKKPKSSVSIDLPSRLINDIAHVFAHPLTRIINAVRRGEGWPRIWKVEEVTVIPKGSWPTEYEGCRNVSCTSVFSKLCETFFLDQLHEEIPPEPHQFGGLKGVGPDHLLSELVTDIMESLDDNRACATLISVDLSKAFNRVDHNVCIQQLAAHGASNQTLRMTANFLDNRQMKIRMRSDLFSTLRDMPGGTPQGTKTGNFLFNTATRGLDDPREGDKQSMASSTSSYHTPPTSPATSEGEKSSPLGGFSKDVRNRRKSCIRDSTDEEEDDLFYDASQHERPPRWVERPLKRVRFVDDLTACSKDDTTSGSRHCTTRKETRVVNAEACQGYLEQITERADATKMKVNGEKTQLLCISTAINSDIRSSIRAGGKEITSEDTLKVIGFTFGRRPGASEHVKALRRKYCLLYTSPSPRDRQKSRMPSSA